MKSGVLVLATILASCGRAPGDQAIGPAIQIDAPLGLPPVPAPVTAAAVALGRKLFFDPKLSADSTVSCASCHDPARAFADGQRFSSGVGKQQGRRNAPTVLNAVYAAAQFWDGRAKTLEEQAAGPIANPVEMNLPHGECVDRLARDASYPAMFAKAFGDPAISMGRVQKAIAAFERTMVSGNSPFDRYFYGGDKSAMPESAVRGMAIFMDRERGNCATCHLAGPQSALFTDGLFHNLGAGLSPEGELTDLGRFETTKIETDKGAFRTPSLRNVALTAPYMHDGSLKTLRAVVDFYAGGGSSNPHLDKEMKPLPLTGRDRDDLVAFLNALTGEAPRLE